MNKSIETQAKNIEAAIEDALTQLGASYDEVDVDIIQEAGFLKKAKVRVTLKEKEVAKPAPVKIEPKPEVKKEEKPKPEVKKEEKPKAEKKEVKKDVKQEKKETKAVEKEVKKKEVAPTGDMPAKFAKTLAFATTLVELLGSKAEVTHETTDKSFNINVNGEGVGQIIGKGGEVMNAIQTLVSSIAIANSAGEQKRVYFNVEDYKERRTETLKALAVRKAEKVKETGRFIKLEPMNARERAIIHSALQEIQGIRTYSTGKEPHRCLCIAPARKDD